MRALECMSYDPLLFIYYNDIPIIFSSTSIVIVKVIVIVIIVIDIKQEEELNTEKEEYLYTIES